MMNDSAAEPPKFPPGQAKIQRIEVQRAINGFFIITPGGIIVIQGEGTPNDMELLLEAVRNVFEN